MGGRLDAAHGGVFGEDLDVSIDEWSTDGKRIVRPLAKMANIGAARAAFDYYVKAYPHARVIVRHRARVIADSHQGAD